jgi:shikimate dehydrogenase
MADGHLMDENRPVTDHYAVIGNPIRHSKSPEIHKAFARAAGVDMDYTTIEAAPGGFLDAVRSFRERGGLGLNVTAPFKLEAYALADQWNERAEAAGSVNTLKFSGGSVQADNFDGIGLLRDIEDNLGYAIAGRRLLLLGAGGAARGIVHPLIARRPAELVIANRDPSRARDVADRVRNGNPVRAGGYDVIGDAGFDLVINATSASMRGELPPAASTIFRTDGLAYDLAYGLGMTPFLSLARSAAVQRVADGVGMLVEQAAESFAWWRGIRPDTRAMISALSVPLA